MVEVCWVSMETSFGWLKQKWGIIGRKLRDIVQNCPEPKETLSKQSCSGKEPGWPLDSPAHGSPAAAASALLPGHSSASDPDVRLRKAGLTLSVVC